MKCGLIKPRSSRLHVFRKRLKVFIFVWFGGLPPNFSDGFDMSLKSPIINQGMFNIVARSIGEDHNSFLLE